MLLIIRQLGKKSWQVVSDTMHQFTKERNIYTVDEVWLVEHYPVFTQGQNANQEDLFLLKSSNIPIKHSDRGGKITYHGPGQQIMYVLLDIKRHKINVHTLVRLLENTVIATLADYGICAVTYQGMPGVYIGKDKICSLGLRISNGCSLHGLALNVNMELSPFLFINPCGYVGLRMVQISQFQPNVTLKDVQSYLIRHFVHLTGFTKVKWLQK